MLHVPDFTSERDAAIAVSALFFVLGIGAFVNIKITGFKLYVPLFFSAIARGGGYACRAYYYDHWPIDRNYVASYNALQAIGFGIGVAHYALTMHVWFKNASERHKPKMHYVLMLACRVLMVLVIICGPILGISSVVLVFGLNKPEYAADGMEIRKASQSGFVCIVSILTLMTLLSCITWLRGELQGRDAEQTHNDKQDRLVFLALFCCLMLNMSSAVRVASIRHSDITAREDLLYPLQVLPELIVLFVFMVPSLAARVALGGRYDAWRQANSKVAGSGNSAEATLVKTVHASAPDMRTGVV